MRELFIGNSEQKNEDGETLTCSYHILIQDCPPPLCQESYGIRISLIETGETAEVMDITTSSGHILSLCERLRDCGVTPCALKDVVADIL